MEFEETMVENDNPEVEELPEEIVEEEDESEESIEEFIEPEEEPKEEPEPQPKAKEAGWIKTRIAEGIEKGMARQRENIMAELEAKYAPIRERLLEMDAQELVRRGEVKDIETAKELVRYRNGQSPEPKYEQPRNEQGQFQSNEQAIQTARTEARIDELKKQADKIKAKGGPDVIAEFNNNNEIKNAVIRGEMDFYDVAETMKKRKRPPSPMRSPNGASGVTPRSIENMSDEQFKKMDKMLDEGVRFTLRK